MTKTCKFSTDAFNRMIHEDEITKLDKMIGIIKATDKRKYMMLVTLIAIALNPGAGFATTFEASLNASADQIINLLLILAKFTFLGLGLKEIITVAITGGTFKDMLTDSSQYLLGYVFIKLYPSIFAIFSTIKF